MNRILAQVISGTNFQNFCHKYRELQWRCWRKGRNPVLASCSLKIACSQVGAWVLALGQTHITVNTEGMELGMALPHFPGFGVGEIGHW